MLKPTSVGVLLLGVAQSLHAQSITDGNFTGFSSINTTYNAVMTVGGQVGYNLNINGGWVAPSGSYTMVWADSALTSMAVANDNGNANLALYPNVTVPPVAGGSSMGIVGGDADTGYPSLIYQQITGLTAGQTYDIYFEYAGAQQTVESGTQQEAWDVGFTSATPTTTRPPVNSGGFTETAVLSNPSKGFTGWYNAMIQVTANGTADYLEFFAEGTPNGQPPFALLTDVRMSVAPEPSTVFGATFLLLPVCIRLARRYRAKASAQT